MWKLSTSFEKQNKKGVLIMTKMSIRTIVASLVCIAFVITAGGQSLESFVFDNISATKVNSKFTPVVIYRLNGQNLKINAMGSSFVANGKTRIITAEHTVYSGGYYAFQRINDPNAEVQYISDVVSLNTDLTGEKTDVLVLEEGSSKIKISPFVSEKSNIVFTPMESNTLLTSLFSGKQVKVTGIALQKSGPYVGTKYYVIDYEARAGESGQGFVDENDNIYVLSGGNSIDPNRKRNMTLVYGPLKF